MLEVRYAATEDLGRIMELVASAKGIMRASGNMLQWADSYPDETVILHDIERGAGRIVEDSEARGERRVAYFAILPSPEPTYSEIDGAWIDDSKPYCVIHRIASCPESHGVFASIIGYALSQCPNLRIDTHEDNRIMQHLILKCGFSYCGIIYLASGDSRLAYQLIR